MGDILNQEYRYHVIQEIEGDENWKRKQESLKRYEIYKERLEEYVYNVLQRDLSQETLDQMRVMSAINLCPRIIDEQSSIYNELPERSFMNSDDKTDELISELYSYSRLNTQLKQSNCMLNLQDQCSIQVIPKDGILKVKVLQPHHYDVIPNVMEPGKADVYILSQYDKDKLFDRVDNQNNVQPQPSGVEYRTKDNLNQTIADESDWKSKRGYYVWWSKDWHFVTDKEGNLLNSKTGLPFPNGTTTQEIADEIVNPIGKLPFVDVKDDNDGEYWARYGNSTVDFTIQLAIILSDTSEVNRLQGFAQAVVSAIEPPTDMKVGPNTVLYLKKSKNADPGAQPSFDFVSPSPDLQGSIELIRTYLSMFLTSKGLDPAVVSADGTAARYASGIDRLLSQIEKFQASQDQFDMYKWIELKVFDLFKSWLEAYSGVSEGGLIPQLSGIIPEDVYLNVKFQKPSDNLSAKDKYDLLVKKYEDGTITKLELIMRDREIAEDEAREVLENIMEERREELLGISSVNRNQNAVGDESEA